MIRQIVGTVMLVCMAGVVSAMEPVEGLWASDNSVFKVYEDNGQLKGQVIALLNPYYTEEEKPEAAGQVRLDDNNPDPLQQTRPIIGLQMFHDYQYVDGRWQGKIYDPESGNTYQSRLKVNRSGELEIRGYVGVPMFGRTATFTSASACASHVVAMLAETDYNNVCDP